MTTQKYSNIKEGRTEINIQEDLTFISPAKGSNNYQKTMRQILDDSLQIPTGEQTASLLHAAYCGPKTTEDGKPFRDSNPVSNIRDIMRNNFIWGARIKLWTPEGFGEFGAGVFSVYDEKGVGLREELDINQLERELRDAIDLREGVISTPNGRIRFASESSYTLGNHTHNSLANDGNVISDFNLEGARKLSKVSKVIGGNPHVYGLDVLKLKKPEQRVSALGGDDDRLHVIGGNFDDNYWCHAFGVLE